MSQTYTTRPCFFTLEGDDKPGAIHSCGDLIRAKVHLNPTGGETLTVGNLRVSFKCKVRTLVTTSNGNNRRTHKSSLYLFCFTTPVLGPRSISVSAQQSWDVAFQFPWEVRAHPTQQQFQPSGRFAHQPGHRLPPTWQRHCGSHVQSVEYYLEAIMTRHGRVIEHEDKERMSLRFVPPLHIPDPQPALTLGAQTTIARTSRFLDPATGQEHLGFSVRAKRLFKSNDDATAVFTVAATAPTVCCLGDSLPVTLRLNYLHEKSTAPEQPEVRLKSIRVRLNSYVQYRVAKTSLFGFSELQRDSDLKIDLASRSFNPARLIFDGMNLNELAPMQLRQDLGPTFVTFSVNRSYMLKISGIFECAGKDYDLTIFRRPLLVHPPRALFRPSPAAIVDGAAEATPTGSSQRVEEETLPPYVSDLPAYKERASK